MRGWMACAVVAVAAGCGGGDGGGESGGSTSSVPIGDFTEQWSIQLEGVENAWPTEDVIYVTVSSNPEESTGSLAVTGIAPSNGAERWTTSITDDGSWGGDFVLWPTNDGALVSYDDAEGGHLVLLDGESGAIKWDTDLEGYAYDLFGEVASGIGLISLEEYSSEFVDLDNGKIVPEDLDWMVFDDQLAVVEDATLRVGVDPFDAGADTQDIDLAGVTPSQVTRVGDTIVAADGIELVGIADGHETFRVDPHVGQIKGFTAVDDRHVVVLGGDPGVLAVLSVDTDGAKVIGSAPDGFEGDDASVAVIEGDTLIEGQIDADPSSDSSNETDELVVLEIGENGLTTRSSTPVSGLADTGFSGGRVLVNTEEGVRVLSAKDLSEVATIDTGEGQLQVGPNYVLTVNKEPGQITLSR